MRIIRKINAMQQFSKANRRKGKTIGFVPTMGALHAGHLSLIRQARKDNDLVVVSIFVNPIQFAPNEDFKRYPRNLSADASICRKAGVDIIFVPQAKEMYPSGYKTFISVEGLGDVLCGKSRSGHFKGVATVVAKLFNIVQPDSAYFGQKDAQQAVIIQRMVMDLALPLKMKVMPTLRQKDGLAISSRNVYLSAQERSDALCIPESLKLAQQLVNQGVRESAAIIKQMKALIGKKKALKIDYIAAVDLAELKPLKRLQGRCLIAIAARIGRVRLIDNIVIHNVGEV